MIRLSVAALIFIAVSTAAGFVLGFLWHELQFWMPAFCLVPGLAAAFLLYGKIPEEVSRADRPSWLERLFFLAFAVFCLRLFFYFFYEQGGMLYTLNNLHLSLPETFSRIHYLAHGRGFWPDHPSLAHALFTNFGMDLFSGLFVLSKVPLTSFLPVSGIVMGLLSLSALYRWARGTGVAGFLFLSGTSVWMGLFGGEGKTGYSEVYRDSVWHSMLGMMQFLSDRGFQFALPCGLFVLWSWRQRFLLKQPGLPASAEWILWLSLPIFHLPSFLLISFLGAVWSLCAGVWKQTLVMAAAAALMTAGMTLGFKDGIEIYPVWSQFQEPGAMRFLWRFGGLFPAVLLAVAGTVKIRQWKHFALLLPGMVLFSVFLLIQASPWRFDQNKTLLVWCLLLLLPVLNEVLEKLRGSFMRSTALTVLFFPGLWVQTDALKWFYTPVSFMEVEKLEAVRTVLERVPEGYRYAAELEISHPVSLNGFPTATSFNDYLFHGGSPEGRLSSDARQLLLGSEDWRQKAQGQEARFVFWGKKEAENYHASAAPWKTEARKIAEGTWGELYDLGSLRAWTEEPSAQGGLKAKLYANAEWKGEALAEFKVKNIDFFWDDTRTKVLSPPWSVLFEGELFIPEKGETVFYLMTDDGGKIEIDGRPVVTDLEAHGKRIASGRQSFDAGWHPVKVYHYDLFGGAAIRWWWVRPSGVEELIPPEYLRS